MIFPFSGSIYHILDSTMSFLIIFDNCHYDWHLLWNRKINSRSVLFVLLLFRPIRDRKRCLFVVNQHINHWLNRTYGYLLCVYFNILYSGLLVFNDVIFWPMIKTYVLFCFFLFCMKKYINLYIVIIKK